MRYRLLLAGILLLGWRSAVWARQGAQADPNAVGQTEARAAVRRWLGYDLRLSTGNLLSQTASERRHVLVCRNGFSLTVAGTRLEGDSAVVRIDKDESGGADNTRYTILVYLKNPALEESAAPLKELGFDGVLVDESQAAVLKIEINGQIYITADERSTGTPQGLLLYREALDAFEAWGLIEPSGNGLPPEVEQDGSASGESTTGYAVSIAPLTDETQFEFSTSASGDQIVTLIGRVYIQWQEPNPEGGPPETIELEADNLAFWRRVVDPNAPPAEFGSLSQTRVSDIYVSGDVRLTQGSRTVRASELYYDLRRHVGIARNGVFSTFDAARGIPIYVRAAELRQVAANEFEATDVTVASSEFRTPQLSLAAGRIYIVDKSQEPTAEGGADDNRFDAKMEDVRLKYYDTTLFAWPSLRSNLVRPDLPIRELSVGSDNTYGPSIETSWFFSRLLGLEEPEGTDSTLQLDYYGKRGPGVGMDVTYEREDYFGRVLGYIIYDQGEDRLSRTQLSVPLDQEVRGRFELRHRHFLPYGWQLTAEASYLSDRNFLEQYYRSEFNAGKEQETLLHLKRIEDNWGLAVLGKVRVNDFLNQVEELPSAEFHWIGQSLFRDAFTFYSDTQVSRYRYLYASGMPSAGPGGVFTYTMTRNEVDMPLAVGRAKIVPFLASTFGYEDGVGFTAALDETPMERKDFVAIGEAGVRVSAQPFWKVYPNVQSTFWDIDQMRHIIRPELVAVAYGDSDPVAQQRDTLDFGIYQRWQTKRGPVGRQRTVDWLRWNVDFVWVRHSGDATAGPDQFLWNQPFIPLVNRTALALPPQDRRTTGTFGPQRSYIGTDVALQLTDSTAILGDMNFDMQSGVVQQINVGYSHMCWPDLSYYIGSRYLRRIVSGDERGSNAVTFAATYRLDPRYTLVFSEQYDFDYGAGIQSDITLIRKYHRMNVGLTLSSDATLDEERIMLTLWPEGLSEIGFGARRFMELGQAGTY